MGLRRARASIAVFALPFVKEHLGDRGVAPIRAGPRLPRRHGPRRAGPRRGDSDAAPLARLRGVRGLTGDARALLRDGPAAHRTRTRPRAEGRRPRPLRDGGDRLPGLGPPLRPSRAGRLRRASAERGGLLRRHCGVARAPRAHGTEGAGHTHAPAQGLQGWRACARGGATRVARALRRVYDRCGPAVARRLTGPWRADLAYLLLAPAAALVRLALAVALPGWDEGRRGS